MTRTTVHAELAADETVPSTALARHYAAHDLAADGGASDPWFRIRLGPVSVRMPNPPARRRALLFHDINHIATGYNTVFTQGEVAVAAFELGAGCGRFAIVWLINLCALGLGLFVAPRGIFGAYVRGRRSDSIYRYPLAPKHLATTTVGEIRDRLRVNGTRGSAAWPDYVSFALWGGLSLAVLGMSAIAALSAVWFVIHAVAR